MMFKTGGFLHRGSALALLLLAVYIFYNLLITPALLARKQAQQDYEATRLQLDKYQALASDLKQVKAQSKALEQNKIDGSDFLAAESYTLAVAELQQQVRQVVQQVGARLVSMQPLELEVEEGFQPVRLRINLRLTNDELLRLLQRLEGMKPRGMVDNLQIQQQVQRNHRKAGSVISQLQVRLEFTAYLAGS